MGERIPGALVAHLYVSDRARAMDFYGGALGLELTGEDAYGGILAVGGGLVRLTVMPDHRAGPHPVLGWMVDDMASTVATLGARGVKMLVYEGMGQDADGVSTLPDGGKLAFFADPDGNVLTLSQEP
jgi:predicted enzyme related to lactoylglutathione lyase